MNLLRTDTEQLEFCDRYFQTVQSDTVYQSEYYREYVLPLEIDKELTDRPFFWMWAEKTGQKITPTTLRLAFSKEARDRENERLKQEALAKIEGKILTPMERMFFRPPTVELIDFGCFRLEKIFQSIDIRGRFACVISSNGDHNQSCVPWVCVNGNISYCCDSIEQQSFSIGICLQNGQIMDDFFSKVSKIPMTNATPNQILKHATVSIQEAINRSKEHILQIVKIRPSNWAIEANTRLHDEIIRLETYYNSIMYDVSEEEQTILMADLNRKKIDLRNLHTPKINVEWKQIALIGLTMKQ